MSTGRRAKLQYACSEGVALLDLYLLALEANYRAHVPYVEALKARMAEQAEDYIPFMDSAREQLQQARRNLAGHQEAHGCTRFAADNVSDERAA